MNLRQLRERLTELDGVLELPLIRNEKPVDPRLPDSPRAFQLETAMGLAIALLDGAAAIRVPRSRFAPVKTTDDLLAVRSDANVRAVIHRGRRRDPVSTHRARGTRTPRPLP